MASKFILVLKDGAITELGVRPPQAPRRTLNAWLGRCASAALSARAKHYAFRHSKKWHVLGVDHPEPIRSFPGDAQAAAEMYLITRSR